MSSNDISGDLRVDLDVAFTTSAEDVRVMRALRAETPSWLGLSHDEVEALVPVAALDRQPLPPPDRRPFTLQGPSEEPNQPPPASR